jgi:hypothetical protein
MVGVNTGFLNTKRRAIFHNPMSGKFFSMTPMGGKYYNPKAKVHKSPGGTERATKYLRNSMHIPTPIRPKFNRVERGNKGAKRGAYAKREGGMVVRMKRNPYLGQLFSPKPKRGRGRPRKSPAVPKMGPVARRHAAMMARKRKMAAKRLYKVKFQGRYV